MPPARIWRATAMTSVRRPQICVDVDAAIGHAPAHRVRVWVSPFLRYVLANSPRNFSAGLKWDCLSPISFRHQLSRRQRA
ncbi:MAG: hypothetical protein JWN81_164 [Solirubrobacterales bacterium]|nr:hypothetical protein [Solirubrobacterales bacterium]